MIFLFYPQLLLFDEAEKTIMESKTSIDDLFADIGPVELDPSYVKEMEQYLQFIEDIFRYR